MTMVAVMPEVNADGKTTYRAMSGDKQSSGKTVGEAHDRLTPQLDEDSTTLILVQQHHPDRFFTGEQQLRRDELMAQWRAARDKNAEFPEEASAELEQLVLAEVRAAGQRASALLRGSSK